MTDHASRTFTGDFKRFFLRGLVVLLPSVLTLWIVVKAYQFVDGSVAQPINHGVRVLLVKGADLWSPLGEKFDPSLDAIRSELWNQIQRGELDNTSDIQSRAVMLAIVGGLAASPSVTPEASAQAERIMGVRLSLRDDLRAREVTLRNELRGANIRQWWADHWYMDLVGVLTAIIAVYTAGRMLGGFLGRRLYKRIEGLITQLPVFKQVYPSVKQIVDFLFGDEQPIKFNRVVAVQYPRKGIWSVGFLTGGSLAAIQTLTGDEAVTVFIPSSPTPFTGYTITVPRTDVLDLALTVDEALRFAVSGGVLVPAHLRSESMADRPETPIAIGPNPDSPDSPPPPASTGDGDDSGTAVADARAAVEGRLGSSRNLDAS